MSFVKPTATLALTIILAISMLVTAAVSFSSLIYVKSNGNLLSLTYAERAVVVGGKQNDIKSAENKTSPAVFIIFNQPSTWNIGSNAKSEQRRWR